MVLYFPKGESFRIYVNGKVHKNVWKTNVTIQAAKVALLKKQVGDVKTGRLYRMCWFS